MRTDSWYGLYRKGWGKHRLRPASFAHPAKAAYGLTVRIYEHALEEGWIEPGQIVLDPFAGIGGFALEAMHHGLHFVGVELEQRFVDMGQGCDCTGISKADWVRFQGRWDRARYQDGRHWCPECLAQAGVVTGERKFKPLPLPGSKWAAVAKARQPAMFDAVPSTSYARNSGKIPCTVAHHYRGNVETWEAQGMPGSAVIVQGDSRRLDEVLERAQLALSSPPFGEADKRSRYSAQGGYISDCLTRSYTEKMHSTDPRNLGNLPDTGFEAALNPPVHAGCLDNPSRKADYTGTGGPLHPVAPEKPVRGVQTPQDTQRVNDRVFSEAQEGAGQPVLAVSSPPFQSTYVKGGETKGFHSHDEDEAYNRCKRDYDIPQSDGQLAQMPEGDLALAISSPPFLAQSGGTNVTAQSGPLADASLLKRHSAGNQAAAGYGSADGQLGAMPTGDHAEALEAGAETGQPVACVSSPPWENSLTSKDEDFLNHKFPNGDQALDAAAGYGSSEGQLGQQQGSTFWAASRQILEEVYQVLAPGGHAIFVCKRFVRSKKIVDFPLQWARLCEAVGFKWIHHHKAWLVEDRGSQHTLEGGLDVRQVKRMSFFRRLHTQKYPHLAILWEDVLCFVKEA